MKSALANHQIDQLIDLVRTQGKAAKAARDAYFKQYPDARQLPFQMKPDGREHDLNRPGHESPVTEWDKTLHNTISQRVREITGIPVLSEEGDPHDNAHIYSSTNTARNAEEASDSAYFTLDPIDGTRNFIEKGNPRYTVLLGLVENGKPIFGVVYHPESDTVFYTKDGEAFMQRGDAPAEPLTIHPPQPGKALRVPATIAASVAGRIASVTAESPGQAAVPSAAYANSNISQYTADIQVLMGFADIGSTSSCAFEWDLAPRQALIEAAGGRYIEAGTDQSLRYGTRADFILPPASAGHQEALRMGACMISSLPEGKQR